MSDNSIPMTLTPSQSEVYNCQDQYRVVAAARGFGKSYLMALEALTAAVTLSQHPTKRNKNVFIIAPTEGQVMQIYWTLLTEEIIPKAYLSGRPNKSNGDIFIKGGVTLSLRSMKSIDRMRGSGAYFVGFDECNHRDSGLTLTEAWTQVVEGCTNRHPDHRVIFISTPKGYDDFYDFWMRGPNPEFQGWSAFQYDYHKSYPMFINKEAGLKQLANAKLGADPIIFRQEWLATFEGSGTSPFHNFDRNLHIQDNPSTISRRAEEVVVGIDFNVGIQAAIIGYVSDTGVIHWVFEHHGSRNTLELAKWLTNPDRPWYGKRVVAYPDPAGRQRATQAELGVTDISILQDEGIIVKAKKKSPKIIDTVNTVNGLLKDANDDVRMTFSPRCQRLITALETIQWDSMDRARLDKKQGQDHWVDALRYYCDFEYGHQQLASAKFNGARITL